MTSRIQPSCEHCGAEPSPFARFVSIQSDALAEIEQIRQSGQNDQDHHAQYLESDYHPVVLSAISLPIDLLFAVWKREGFAGLPARWRYLEDHECWAVRAAYAVHPEGLVNEYSPLLVDDDFRVRAAVWSRTDLSAKARDMLRFEFGEVTRG